MSALMIPSTERVDDPLQEVLRLQQLGLGSALGRDVAERAEDGPFLAEHRVEVAAQRDETTVLVPDDDVDPLPVDAAGEPGADVLQGRASGPARGRPGTLAPGARVSA